MSFRYLELLFPLLVALHNAEEAICLPRWTRRSGPWFGGPWFGGERPVGVQPAVFRFAAVVLTALAFVITVLSAVAGRMSFWGNLAFGYMVGMLFNAFVPHIAVSIAKGTLMPGVVTGAVLNVPILSGLAVLALRQGYVSAHDAVVFSIVVPLLLLLMIPVLFRLGKVVAL
jgi:hypothetical protein